jgi:hypothetical protein
MATTTNYGWTTPDDTALVKDGASAIRTLGSSVDTTTKNLNPSTTLGDIEYRSSTSNVNTRLGIGTTGQLLSVSGGVPAWATVASGAMTLISTTTFTGTSVTLSSIPATYTDLKIVIRDFSQVVDSERLLMRFNADSTANRHAFSYANSAVIAAGTATTFSRTSIILTEGNDNTATDGLCIIDIDDYANTTTWKIAQYVTISNDTTTTTSFRATMALGMYNQTAAISSLQFLFDGVDADGGTILLYGVK